MYARLIVQFALLTIYWCPFVDAYLYRQLYDGIAKDATCLTGKNFFNLLQSNRTAESSAMATTIAKLKKKKKEQREQQKVGKSKQVNP